MKLLLLFALLAGASAFAQPAALSSNAVARRPTTSNAPALYMSSTVNEGSNAKRNLIDGYMRQLETKPLKTKMWTSGIICGLGDILSQGFAVGGLGELRHVFDLQRMIVYGLIGGFYLAPLVHYWFAVLEKVTAKKNADGTPVKAAASEPTGLGVRMRKALKMVFLDQAVASPFLNGGFLFAFAAISALATGHGFGGAASTGVHKVQTALWPTLLASWRIWPVANLINFAFVPVHLRVLFLNLVGVGWNVIMSSACN